MSGIQGASRQAVCEFIQNVFAVPISTRWAAEGDRPGFGSAFARASGHRRLGAPRGGHASIKINVDTYYHWLPNQHIGEVSELDEIGKASNNPQPIRNQKEQGATTEVIPH